MHTPGKGGPTSVKEEEVGNKTHCTLSVTQGMQYTAEILLMYFITYTINHMYAVSAIVNRAIGTTWITVGVLKVPS